MKELENKLFHTLWKDNFYHHHYVVTNDGNYFADFYADNDAEALQIFRNGDYKN